jgi:hypothetical protein
MPVPAARIPLVTAAALFGPGYAVLAFRDVADLVEEFALALGVSVALLVLAGTVMVTVAPWEPLVVVAAASVVVAPVLTWRGALGIHASNQRRRGRSARRNTGDAADAADAATVELGLSAATSTTSASTPRAMPPPRRVPSPAPRSTPSRRPSDGVREQSPAAAADETRDMPVVAEIELDTVHTPPPDPSAPPVPSALPGGDRGGRR